MMRVSDATNFDQIPSNRELLARYVATRDETAFATLVERFGPMVLGVARRLLSDFEDADDAAQLAFAELAHRAGTIENPDALAGWLHTVTAHIALRLRKRRPGHTTLAAEPVDPRLSLEHIAKRSDFEVLSEELDRLPHDWREPLLLRYFSGLSNEETAVQLGTSVTAVEGRLKRGKQSLRARLLRRGVSAAALLAAVGPAKYAHAAGQHPLDADHWSSITDAARDVATEPSNLSFVPTLETTTMTPLITFKAALATGVAAVVLATVSGDGHGTATAPHSAPITTAIADDQPSSAPTALALSDTAQPAAESVGDSPEPEADTVRSLTSEPSPLNIKGYVDVVDGEFVASEADDPFAPTTSDDPLGASGGVSDSDPFAPDENSTPDRAQQIEHTVESTLLCDIAVQFVDSPLSELAVYVADDYGIQVNIDEAALSDLGISTDDTFTLVAKYGSLARCLDVILQEKFGDLDFVAREDELLITTVDHAETLVSTKLYAIPSSVDASQMISAIEAHVRPDSWQGTGGVGVMTAFPGGNATSRLLVTTSYRGHREVADFLELLQTTGGPQEQATSRPRLRSDLDLDRALTPAEAARPETVPQPRLDSPGVARSDNTTGPRLTHPGPGAMLPQPATIANRPEELPPTTANQPPGAQSETTVVAYDIAKVSRLLYEPKPKAGEYQDYGAGDFEAADEFGGGYPGGGYGGSPSGMAGMGMRSQRPRLITLAELGQFSGTVFSVEMVVQRGSQLLVRTDAQTHQEIRQAIAHVVQLLEEAGPPEVSGETRISITPTDNPFGGGYDDTYGGGFGGEYNEPNGR